jgi:hypothetical protein
MDKINRKQENLILILNLDNHVNPVYFLFASNCTAIH